MSSSYCDRWILSSSAILRNRLGSLMPDQPWVSLCICCRFLPNQSDIWVEVFAPPHLFGHLMMLQILTIQWELALINEQHTPSWGQRLTVLGALAMIGENGSYAKEITSLIQDVTRKWQCIGVCTRW